MNWIKKLFSKSKVINKIIPPIIYVVNNEPIEEGDYFIDKFHVVRKCYGTKWTGIKKRHFTVKAHDEWVGNSPIFDKPKKIIDTSDLVLKGKISGQLKVNEDTHNAASDILGGE